MSKEKETVQEKRVAITEPSMSQRFATAVAREFGESSGKVQITDYQKTLAQGYYIAIDQILQATEAERVRKNEKNTNHNYDNNLPCTWANVNMESLARDVMYYSKLGLDMLADNQLFAIPYKNKKANKYDLGFIKGYNGIKLLAEKYALVQPKAVTIEVVYSTDAFKPIKKGRDNPFETYQFEIINAFDRGEIVGGFGYIEYDDPARNTLYFLNMREIEKRKPKYAAAEFWGGTKKEYNSDKTVEVEGWKDEMVYKTMIRHTYGKIPLDSARVQEAFQHIQSRERELKDVELANEISENANKETINITPEPTEQAKEIRQPKPEPESQPADNGLKVDF